MFLIHGMNLFLIIPPCFNHTISHSSTKGTWSNEIFMVLAIIGSWTHGFISQVGSRCTFVTSLIYGDNMNFSTLITRYLILAYYWSLFTWHKPWNTLIDLIVFMMCSYKYNGTLHFDCLFEMLFSLVKIKWLC